jgi:putative hemolysin
MLFVELGIIILLTLVNAAFALSELAIVSSRPARLKLLADRSVRGARRAMALAADPGRFLSTVQIGITLVGVLSGAFSGATLGARLTASLEGFGVSARLAQVIGVGVIVTSITYLSLIVGELVPKQIALRNPERIAVSVAPAMTFLAKAASPIVWALDGSARLMLRLLGYAERTRSKVSDEEIRTIVAEAETAGVIEPGERAMIAGVMRLGDRTARAVMTPRKDVEMIDIWATPEDIRQQVANSGHSWLPVRDEIDAILGVVHARDFLRLGDHCDRADLRACIRQVPSVPETVDALDAVDVLAMTPVHMALVYDEYGNFEGIVTMTDILKAIASELRSDAHEHFVRRQDGSWLVSGTAPIDELAERLGLKVPAPRTYETAAGFVLSHLERLPATGDTIDQQGWRFEVVDMDGRRIDKLLVHKAGQDRESG